MKKIGILTFHRSFNYGAYLQCYSLCSKLEKTFPDVQVEIIDYNTLKAWKMYWKIDLYKCIHSPNLIPSVAYRRISFNKAVRQLKLSPYKIVSSDYKRLYKKMKKAYDVIIVGSDVVWNFRNRGFPNAYWLNYDFGCPKMAYAVSVHGTDFEQITDFQKTYCKKSLEDFSYIGYRDKITEQFLRSVGQEKIFKNCDPAFLIDLKNMQVDRADLWDRIKTKYKLDEHKKNIIVMSDNLFIGKLINKKYGKSCNIITLYDNNVHIANFIYDLTPIEWAVFFSFAAVTITTFFHGTIFSMLNSTPFVAISDKEIDKKYSGKVEDLCTCLECDDYFFKLSDIQKCSKTFIQVVDNLLQHLFIKNLNDKITLEKMYYNSFENKLKEILS